MRDYLQIMPTFRHIFLLFSFLHWMTAVSSQDNRCFLEGGGSVENFFVSEALPVGGFVGTLRVIGNPAINGDILLRLPDDAAIKFAPGSKNLTLNKKLDKEPYFGILGRLFHTFQNCPLPAINAGIYGCSHCFTRNGWGKGVEGPSSITASVICERKGAFDPGFTIPVNLRVTDVNDNAPIFQNTPYEVTLSETTPLGSLVFQGVKAIDNDQSGLFSTVQYSVKPGIYSSYIDFLSSLAGTLVLKRQLDYESFKRLEITLVAQDQGVPSLSSETTFTINVLDADDQNPRFSHQRYFATLPDVAEQGTALDIEPAPLYAEDQDEGIRAPLFYKLNGESRDAKYFTIDGQSGVIYLVKSIPDTELLQPITLVIQATQTDNEDRYALTTVTVSRNAAFSPLLQFLARTYSIALLENVPENSVVLTLTTNRPGDKKVNFTLYDNGGLFALRKNGELVLKKGLDYEIADSHQFYVWASDGITNDTALINVTVLNVNDWDPRFRHSQYDFYISDPKAGNGFIVGAVQVADGDRGDRLTFELKGPDYPIFAISPEGVMRIANLSLLNRTVANVVVVAKDSGNPPRRASVPVTVTFPSELVSASTWALLTENNYVLLIGLTGLLAILTIVISGLAIYICKYKKRKVGIHPQLNGMKPNGIGSSIYYGVVDPSRTVLHNPLAYASTRRITPLNPSQSSGRTHSPNIINQNGRSGPDLVPPRPPSTSPSGNESRISDELHHATNGSVASSAWPMGSIPRRVKKLSWEDENEDTQSQTETEPHVTVAPLPSTSRGVNGTRIYF